MRVASSLSLEEVEAKTGLAKSLIARLENGQEVPTLDMLDTLADALGVPVHRFFYDGTRPPWTPRLTSRPCWNELAEGCPYRPAPVRLAKPRGLVLTALQALWGLAARMGGQPQVHRRPTNPMVQITATIHAGTRRSLQIPEHKL
jgi:transcriptional regulator with XRE-family HTH domain